MPDSYTVLAPIYDKADMSAARLLVPSMLDYAQQNDWLGRHITDFGCGTGTGALWLAEAGYNVTALDRAPQMLEIAQSRGTQSLGITVEWHEADIRSPGDALPQTEMVLAVDVLNEVENVKDLQAAFASAFNALKDDKLFIFDMHTIEGLSQRGAMSDQILHDADGLTMFGRNDYDYERQMSVRHYLTFMQDESGAWSRLDATRVLRAFPLQAVAALLQRTGFSDVHLLDIAFNPYDARRRGVYRVIFVAKK